MFYFTFYHGFLALSRIITEKKAKIKEKEKYMRIIETFKSVTDKERREAITNIIVNLENKDSQRNTIYSPDYKMLEEPAV
jgi:glycyl-tRNA synthetase beta subunit